MVLYLSYFIELSALRRARVCSLDSQLHPWCLEIPGTEQVPSKKSSGTSRCSISAGANRWMKKGQLNQALSVMGKGRCAAAGFRRGRSTQREREHRRAGRWALSGAQAQGFEYQSPGLSITPMFSSFPPFRREYLGLKACPLAPGRVAGFVLHKVSENCFI